VDLVSRLAWLAVLISIVVLVAGCSSSSDWSDQDISNAASVWVNQLGLNQSDEDVWSDRLGDICAADADSLSLAEQFMTDDAEYSVRSDGTMPALGEVVVSLDIIQLQTCER
jgi:hypothetical protein